MAKAKKDYAYIVSANLYSELANDYIYHWDGQKFYDKNDYSTAFDFWNFWRPPQDEIDKQADKWFAENPNDRLELEIGLWSDTGESCEFWNEML